ncbi:tetratricopeptide repeat protein [Desulfuromonas sp. DDH964]|uniref:tetratricopeptide repeat protein n=1 Tax=Desulfuromonas sp. DDH964 TaxID=1823759 RepID=UPI00082FBAE0|nr:tetratricopeptide repeat protein [Desulfuromonas sp. DDH964]
MPDIQEGAPMGRGDFRFWTPPAGFTVKVGPEERPVVLPDLPLPLKRQLQTGEAPAADAIGSSLYDYLRQFPDGANNRQYAELLRDAWPHYLADLGAMALMLDHKEVDPPYVKRKINALKILALLEPENAGLHQQIGMACFHLALNYQEMSSSRQHLQQALKHLHLALEHRPGDPASLNLLGQTDFLLGDYPAAARSWRQLHDHLAPSPAREALAARLERITRAGMPDHPLVEELEAVGHALELCGEERFAEARLLLDQLEEQGELPRELPAAEFYYLLGVCRERTGEPAGAFDAFSKALELDSDYQPARDGIERIQGEKGDKA